MEATRASDRRAGPLIGGNGIRLQRHLGQSAPSSRAGSVSSVTEQHVAWTGVREPSVTREACRLGSWSPIREDATCRTDRRYLFSGENARWRRAAALGPVIADASRRVTVEERRPRKRASGAPPVHLEGR